jgi:hypothetical protein
MSRWGKPKKNKKRFDARYFMSEREERIDELHPGDPGVGSLERGRDEEEESKVRGSPFPGGSIEDLPPVSDDILQQEKEKALATKLGLPWRGERGPGKMKSGDFDWSSVSDELDPVELEWNDVADELESAKRKSSRTSELEET